ncbi:MAG: hypothetical protein ACOYT4_02650 [Nanoarchaeota archaeon]
MRQYKFNDVEIESSWDKDYLYKISGGVLEFRTVEEAIKDIDKSDIDLITLTGRIENEDARKRILEVMKVTEQNMLLGVYGKTKIFRDYKPEGKLGLYILQKLKNLLR